MSKASQKKVQTHQQGIERIGTQLFHLRAKAQKINQNVAKTTPLSSGVPRLDGARGKKQVWRPHVRT